MSTEQSGWPEPDGDLTRHLADPGREPDGDVRPALGEALAADPAGEPLTHFFHCWRSPRHHACAVALIERQASEMDTLIARNAILRRRVGDALHLRMNGERAPGGGETWREWDRGAELDLRSETGHEQDGATP